MQSKHSTIRIAVVRDTTGELSLAADYSDKNLVYSVGKNATVGQSVVRSVPKLNTLSRKTWTWLSCVGQRLRRVRHSPCRT